MLTEVVDSENENDKTLFFSNSLCSTYHSVDGGEEFYLTWNGTLLPMSKGCKITFFPKDPLSVCVEVEFFHLEDCSVHTYKCSGKPDNFCGSQNEAIDIELFSRSTNPLYGSNSFRFKIHTQVPISVLDYVWINVGLISLVVVIVGISLAYFGLSRRARKSGIVFRRSEIPHTRMVDSETLDQPQINSDPVPWNPTNEVLTTDFTIPDPRAVNTE